MPIKVHNSSKLGLHHWRLLGKDKFLGYTFLELVIKPRNSTIFLRDKPIRMTAKPEKNHVT